MKRLSLAVIVALSGCATPSAYTVTELPIPEPPTLPTVAAGDLECLSDAAYESLAVRDALRKGYAEQLRAIIEAHNRKAK
jgi:hypothetical protein